jgi:hypothetical protein
MVVWWDAGMLHKAVGTDVSLTRLPYSHPPRHNTPFFQATRMMAEMREQIASAAAAHKSALDAAEAQAADARQLADLYEQQVADLTARVRTLQQGGGVSGPAAPGTPTATQPAAPPRPLRGPTAAPAATAAELLAQSPGGVAEGLQAQGKSFADVVALYTDMVGLWAPGSRELSQEALRLYCSERGWRLAPGAWRLVLCCCCFEGGNN